MFFWRKVRGILYFLGDFLLKMYSYMIVTVISFVFASFLVFISVQNYQTCGITGNGVFSVGFYITSSPLVVTDYNQVSIKKRAGKIMCKRI